MGKQPMHDRAMNSGEGMDVTYGDQLALQVMQMDQNTSPMQVNASGAGEMGGGLIFDNRKHGRY